MNTLLTFDLERTYPAPPERVWAAWTQADLFERWVLPDADWRLSVCEVDPREGGGYRLRFGPRPAGDDYRETATFTLFEPVEKLEFDVLTEGADMSESSHCTVIFKAVEEGTRLQLTVEGREGITTLEHLRTGWTWCLEGIAKELAR